MLWITMLNSIALVCEFYPKNFVFSIPEPRRLHTMSWIKITYHQKSWEIFITYFTTSFVKLNLFCKHYNYEPHNTFTTTPLRMEKKVPWRLTNNHFIFQQSYFLSINELKNRQHCMLHIDNYTFQLNYCVTFLFYVKYPTKATLCLIMTSRRVTFKYQYFITRVISIAYWAKHMIIINKKNIYYLVMQESNASFWILIYYVTPTATLIIHDYISNQQELTTLQSWRVCN